MNLGPMLTRPGELEPSHLRCDIVSSSRPRIIADDHLVGGVIYGVMTLPDQEVTSRMGRV